MLETEKLKIISEFVESMPYIYLNPKDKRIKIKYENIIETDNLNEYKINEIKIHEIKGMEKIKIKGSKADFYLNYESIIYLFHLKNFFYYEYQDIKNDIGKRLAYHGLIRSKASDFIKNIIY